MNKKKRMADLLMDKMIQNAAKRNVASKAIADFMFSEIIGDIFEKYDISDDDLRSLTRKAVNGTALLFDVFKNEEDFAIFVSNFSVNTKELENPHVTVDMKKITDFIASVKASLANASDEDIEATFNLIRP